MEASELPVVGANQLSDVVGTSGGEPESKAKAPKGGETESGKGGLRFPPRLRAWLPR